VQALLKRWVMHETDEAEINVLKTSLNQNLHLQRRLESLKTLWETSSYNHPVARNRLI